MYRTLFQTIHEASHTFSNLPALSIKTGFRTKTYTYKQIYDFIIRFPSFLEKNHIKKGDKIIIFSVNRPEYAVTILGTMKSRVIVVPIDYRTNHETIKKFAKLTEPKAIFTSVMFKDLFHGIEGKLFLFEELFSELATHDVISLDHPDPEDLAAILFTSGTTGEPKGTMITYENIIASINNIRQVFSLPTNLRILSILPLSHALEMFGGLMVSYSYGCHIHYLERINSITIMQALKRYKIQAMAVVPQMLRLVLQNIERRVENEHKEQAWKKAHAVAPLLPRFLKRKLFRQVHENLGSAFQFFVCGSAPLDIKIVNLWKNMGIDIVEGYGASETTGFIATNTLTSNKVGTVGKILPGIQSKRSETGELLVHGKNITKGYFHNEEKTKESYQDGWFHTGDIVQFDTQGYMKIVGRDKFKIVLSDGMKVYPEDIEKKLNNHPLVVDSTVFGVDKGEGEIVHAEIICKSPNKIASLVQEVNLTLNPHEQIMDYGVWKQQDFPRTKTLKVDRQAVKDSALAQSASAFEKQTVQKEEKDDPLLRILTSVSGKKNISLRGNTLLASDLKLDSLKRIELLAYIEEELGISVDELKITPQTTIQDLRTLIQQGKPTAIDDGLRTPKWQFTNNADKTRVFLQDILAFPLFRTKIKIRVIHPENIQKITTPQLFIFNHVGIYDVITCVLPILPQAIRQKTAIAATHVIWTDNKFHGFMASLFANGLPFVKAESNGAMRGNFERVGQALDKGYNIAISPEGNITHTGELLPFHTGAGYIAVEMGVPVTPFKINGYFEIWPEDDTRKYNLYWPKKSGVVDVIVGEPIVFAPHTSYEDATKILREKMLALS